VLRLIEQWLTVGVLQGDDCEPSEVGIVHFPLPEPADSQCVRLATTA